MKPIYIVMIYECGKWDCCYSFGYFTNQNICMAEITKLNQQNIEQGRQPQYAIKTIYKNETKRA